MVLKQTCPLCKLPAYHGFVKVECIGPKCPNYSATLYKEQIPKEIDLALESLKKALENNYIANPPTIKFPVGSDVRYFATGPNDGPFHGAVGRVWKYSPSIKLPYLVDFIRFGNKYCREGNLEFYP